MTASPLKRSREGIGIALWKFSSIEGHEEGRYEKGEYH